MPTLSRMRRPLLMFCVLAAALAAVLAGSVPASAGVANGGLPGAPSNPLGGLRWGNYDGNLDEVFPAYRAASGRQRALLGAIALRPRMRWFGQWYDDPETTARQYIDNVTAADPDALVQIAVFAMRPWEGALGDISRQLPSAGDQAAYRNWIDGFARGIGRARVALLLQPDLPLGDGAPHHSNLPYALVAYAARELSALPHTTVYLDVGASDWPSVSQAVSILRRAGVRYVRGFALGATHYASTADEIGFGAEVVTGLQRAGLPGKHFVINTAQNGRPFTYQQYHGPNFDNAAVCRSRRSRRCVTLGIPPTAQVASPRWGLSAPRPEPGRAVRRRLPVDRAAVAGQPGRPVRSQPVARAGGVDAVLRAAGRPGRATGPPSRERV